MKEYNFRKAVPVWEKGKDKEINYHLAFRVVVGRGKNVKIALAASNLYQMFVNGRMTAEGPARAGHGYYRVDEIELTDYLDAEENIIVIYVAGYYVKNFYLIRQPAFLCAEVIIDGQVAAATGVTGPNGEQAAAGFEAIYHKDRIRKVTRFSGQRTFTESYRYGVDYKAFETIAKGEAFPVVELEQTVPRRFTERSVPYPEYSYVGVEKVIAGGKVVFAEQPVDPYRPPYIQNVTAEKGFLLEQLEILNCDETDKGRYTIDPEFTGLNDTWPAAAEAIDIPADSFVICALPGEKTGFLTLEAECSEKVQLMAVFDEILTDGDVSGRRMNTVNSVIWLLEKGEYSLVTQEPYSMRYVKLINKSAESTVRVKRLGITEFTFPYRDAGLYASFDLVNKAGDKQTASCDCDATLEKIYNAAVETFRQNTLDIYMDCPSRERAGWLCDSFFTSRVEYALTGQSLVEKNFLENFIYTDGTQDIVSGMLPMCYPSDFATHRFIPQWAMWFVLELDEYLKRSGDRELVYAARDKVLALLEYFKGYENEDGLLENLESWNFIEWSKANEFVDGVNYPTNMLYAKMLRTVERLYGEPGMTAFGQKADEILEKVKEQSYFDGFFHDHALRTDGKLQVVEGDVTETCQYYAFFTETATKDSYPQLWSRMLTDFGPDRVEKGLWKHIYPSNAFIGYYLRLELLAKAGYGEMVLDNIREFFGGMAEATGTLWEHNRPTASCNHGFASHVILWLKQFADCR